MDIKAAVKSLSNFKWIAKSAKAFLPSIILIIIIESIVALGSVATAIVSKSIIDYAEKGIFDKIITYSVIFLLIIVFNLATNGFLSVYSARLLEQYSNALRQSIFSKLINMEWLDVNRYHSGDLLTRMTSDISTVANGCIKLPPQFISLGVQLIAAFITLMIYEPSLALLAFVLAPFTIVLSRFYGRKIKNLHLKMQETESQYRSQMQEYIQNLMILKTFNLEEQSKKKVGELQKERLHWVTERNKTGVSANIILALGYWVGYFLAFGWGALKLAKKTASFGTMTAFLQLVNQIQSPFIGLSRTLPQIIASMASAGRLIELESLTMESKGEAVDVPDAAGFSFDNVTFRYDKEEKVLDSVSMEAKPGEIIALVGTSGEGKTTMVRLLLALLKPESGEVKCFDDNGNEMTISSSTRNWFSYVPQGNTLLSGSIADNLRSGKLDCNEDEMRNALEIAGALDFIDKLPDGINTQIGEKACGLSEGQAQRIAIARAILRKSPIIILDEATSALNIELEEKILQGIQNLKPARTCLMITHRKTALGMCNKVYKLKEGILTLE